MRLLNPDVMKREVACPLVVYLGAFFCFSGVVVVCIETAQSRCDEKRK